ncbi:2,5-diamino-6-(ribosylamino)-4(3H)-pyrimidinone 5'-phosphate reductase, partial [Ascosphaera atra]
MSGPAYNPYGEESYAMHMHSDMGVDPSVAGNSGAGAGANINYEHGHAGDENIEHGGNTMEFDEDEDLDGNYEEQDDFDGHDRSHAMLSEVGVGADVQHAEHGSAPQPLHPSSTAAPPELGMRVGEGNLQGQAQLQQGHQYQAPLPQAQQGQAQEQQGQQENSSGDYSLYNNPPNLRRIREILFELKEPAEISLEEFETYWPFVDNVWVKQRSNSTKDGLMTTDYYMCRLRRPTCRGAPSESSSPDVQRHPEEQRQRNRLRNKKRREGCACNVQIK